MTSKSVSRASRLIGFVVSPLLTAPAAAAILERAANLPGARGDAPPSRYVADSMPAGAPTGTGRRRRST